MNKLKQMVRCDVNNCKYNDEVDCLCSLDVIDVSCTCNRNKCNDKVETICNSFKEKEN